MGTRYVIKVDLADVWAAPDRKELLRTLAWGDEIVVNNITPTALEIEVVVYVQQQGGSVITQKTTGFIVPRKSQKLRPSDLVAEPASNDVLRVNFVDVQQGDGAVIESPDGKVILVDGGDNQLFARYLAGRFNGTTAAKPKDIDCILVTHGDADHFAGLVEIFDSETLGDVKKQLFIRPHRVFHNGIVKRPSTRNDKRVPDRELLGATKQVAGSTYITGLEENLLEVDDAQMNQPFRRWKAALAHYDQRQKIAFRRLQLGDNEAFDFFNDGAMRIEVLGPIPAEVDGKPALKFLGEPPEGPRIGHESLEDTALRSSGLSASHTINGHSVVFKLGYGGFSYLFCGDLNDESSRFLARENNKGTINLRSEVFKVPHHGSADFSGAFLQAVSPIASVVSSGDENVRKEYIHPRATLVGALGKYSRVPEPLVFVTELVAFFTYEGSVVPTSPARAKERGTFQGFSRAAFGMVKTRTNGSRLLIYTDSANAKLKEAYAYELDASGQPLPAPVKRV
ncbi:ComEC/Rec2 family competence protein [Variovorax rhizosphaerae]|uniref:MBL fold metallo-hydrolase n=1 Tax=Variovorax rhizosphaerae TaxID=1836200 RepID=A0ABU8WEC5_9BURK